MLRTVVLLIAVLAHGAFAVAQDRLVVPPPDFSGTWTVIDTGERIIYSPVGPEFTVAHNVEHITVTWTSGGSIAPGTVTYRLDGSEQQVTTKSVVGEPWLRTSGARLVSNALLVITKTDRASGGSWENLMVMSFDTPNVLSVVYVFKTPSPDPIMNTKMFKYSRKVP